MIKPITAKQTNKFQENHGKFISKLFNLEAIGTTKKEAEENLSNLLQWVSEPFYRIFQHNDIVIMLKRSQYTIGDYQYFRLVNGNPQGMSIFDAENDIKATEKAQIYFNQYINCIGGLSA